MADRKPRTVTKAEYIIQRAFYAPDESSIVPARTLETDAPNLFWRDVLHKTTFPDTRAAEKYARDQQLEGILRVVSCRGGAFVVKPPPKQQAVIERLG